MVELEILDKKDEYVYYLKDDKENKYEINLEFFDIDNKPKVGESIYMHEELLDPKYVAYSTSYTFGNLENEYGKKDLSLEDIDIIKIKLEDKEIYLKRLYG